MPTIFEIPPAPAPEPAAPPAPDLTAPFCCGVCGIPFTNGKGWMVVRQRWFDLGGFGTPPAAAMAHVACDRRERRQDARQLAGKRKEPAA